MKHRKNDLVEFFNPFGSDILKGIVVETVEDMLCVKIQHGIHHGQVWQIFEEDVLGDYDELETEEKFLYFRNED